MKIYRLHNYEVRIFWDFSTFFAYALVDRFEN